MLRDSSNPLLNRKTKSPALRNLSEAIDDSTVKSVNFNMFKTLWASCVLVCICISAATNASQSLDPSLTQIDSSCTCEALAGDELEHPIKFNFGAFSGQCIDSCRFRKSVLLSSQDNSTMVFSNFMHNGEFWKVRVHPDGITQARIGFEEFMPGIFHVFLIFDFDKSRPLSLEPQIKTRSSKTQAVSSLVFSPEGVPAREKKYNFFDAYLNRYVLGHRLLSAEQVFQYSVIHLKHKVTTYPLKLNKPQLNKLIAEALKTVQSESFNHHYRLFSNNCATNVLNLIDKVDITTNSNEFVFHKVIQSIERALPVAGPIGVVQLLAKRNLISQPSAREIKGEQSTTL